jgi:hypothetical protein
MTILKHSITVEIKKELDYKIYDLYYKCITINKYSVALNRRELAINRALDDCTHPS